MRLYEQFVRAGSLVFDVGANCGEYTETFAALGARVVALEPNPQLADRLRGLAARWPVYVLPYALGRSPGTARLHVCAGRPDLSTISEDWQKASAVAWTHSVDVHVTTIDALAAQYGIPDFVKIDTEGFDDQVIAGMSFRPSHISFELLAVNRAVASRVVEQLDDAYLYNYTIGERFQLQPRWFSASEVRAEIETAQIPEGYADIIAARRSSGSVA
jgi:FkbM family methyltransferase